MKKILLASDGHHFPKGAFDFASRVHEISPVLLTGVFLRRINYLTSLMAATGHGGGDVPVFLPITETYDNSLMEENIQTFTSLCEKNDIAYRVHQDTDNFAIPELKKETRFADLLIISSESFYKESINAQPSEYLEATLRHAECPMLVVPEMCDFPESIILAYDGSESSVYAIKQFAYLFPELCGKQALLVYENDDNDKDMPEQWEIDELATRHFSDLALLKLKINPQKAFNEWISSRQGSLLVAGAYGQTAIGRLFHKSFVSGVIRDYKIPVFITHR